MEVKLLVVRVRSLKNEEVVIPSSLLLTSNVVNLSTFARQQGLILHTTVGIGYETPWRQVEAMLKLAAGRTPDLLREPAPFVLQTALGDFCITYELNAYCDDAQAMPRLYTALHQNILDVFNEYGVQIMTPPTSATPRTPRWSRATSGSPHPRSLRRHRRPVTYVLPGTICHSSADERPTAPISLVRNRVMLEVSVAVMLRLVGPVHGHADVCGLVWPQFGKVRADLGEMQPCHLFI